MDKSTETNLQIAIRTYPKGVKYKSAFSGNEFVSTGEFREQWDTTILDRYTGGYVYSNGIWAKLIEPQIDPITPIETIDQYQSYITLRNEYAKEIKAFQDKVNMDDKIMDAFEPVVTECDDSKPRFESPLCRPPEECELGGKCKGPFDI